MWGGTWLPRATYVNYSHFCTLEGVRIYTCPYVCTQLKVHGIINKNHQFNSSKYKFDRSIVYLLLDGPGVSFVDGIVCPQASQMCCDSYFHDTIETKKLLIIHSLAIIPKTRRMDISEKHSNGDYPLIKNYDPLPLHHFFYGKLD